MIRDAKASDIPRMVEMGLRFRRETSYGAHLRENSGKMMELAASLVEKNTALIAEREGKIIGMLGYYIFDHFLSGDKMAIEVFWWMEPEYRTEGMKLLIEMKKRAKAAGAMYYQMIAPSLHVAHFYERIGMRHVESTYQGNL